MGDKDWMILEYPNLRTTAKNRIADLIVKDELVGFFHVSLLRKAKSNKLDYYWPASKKMVERFGRNMEGGDANFFRNEPDTDTKSSSTEWVDRTIKILDSKPLLYTPVLVALYRLGVDEMVGEPAETYASRLEPVFERIELDDPDRSSVEYENWLLFIVFLIRVLGFETLNRFLEDIISGRVPPEVQSRIRAS